MNVDNIGFYHQEQLLRYFFNYLQQGYAKGQRGHLIRQLPEAYNAACGRPIAKVVLVDNEATP